MSFLWPLMLTSLALLPLPVVAYLRLQRRRAQLATRYGGLWLAPGGGADPGRRRHIGPALFLAALALLGLALARPQATVSLPRLEGTLILVFDVSASMGADDVPPTRLAAAQAAAADLVERQPDTVQIGVVAFSDGGLAAQLPGYDREETLAAIGRLAPQYGTSLGEGLLAALTMVSTDGGDQVAAVSPSAVVVIFSDGENTAPPNPLEVAVAAADLGVQIFTVGVGTPQGVTLQLDGFSVNSRLDAATLQQMAEIAKGAYFAAQDTQGIAAIADAVASELVVSAEQTELTALLAGAALLLLLGGGMYSFVAFGRLV